MKSSAHAMSELMAGSMTTTGRTMDVTARLTYVPRDPHVITVTITDRAGAVPIWTIGRDLLLGGLIARASCPAGMGQIRLWTCQSRSGPSLIIARMTSYAAFLEVDLKEVADFVMGTLELVPQDEEFRQLNLDAEPGRLIAGVVTDRERRILDRP
jgi:Streptomyces sporulation and cell division protein, SsgA